MAAAICAGVSRSPTPIREGIAGGEPVIFSPWKMPRTRRGAGGKRLFGSGNFAGHSAGRIFAGFDGEKRLSVAAVEEIDETLFRRLRYRINLFPVALHGEERGR